MTALRRLLSRKVSRRSHVGVRAVVGAGARSHRVGVDFLNYDTVTRLVRARCRRCSARGAELAAFGLTTLLWPLMLLSSSALWHAGQRRRRCRIVAKAAHGRAEYSDDAQGGDVASSAALQAGRQPALGRPLHSSPTVLAGSNVKRNYRLLTAMQRSPPVRELARFGGRVCRSSAAAADVACVEPMPFTAGGERSPSPG